MAFVETTGRRPFRLTGWHVLAAIGGLFAVMTAVNVLFVVLALNTFSGETEHAYMKGLRFNETLARREAQSTAGWTMTLGLDRPATGMPSIEARLVDRAGRPVSGAAMTGVLARTTTDREDHMLTFIEIAPGTYRAEADRLGPGRWRFVATARLPGEPDFETETTLSLR